MNKMQKIASFLLLGILVLGTASLASANQSESDRRARPNQRPAINQETKAALEAGDYEAFLAAHPEGAPILEEMTEEKFEQMLEIHALMKAGDIEGAQALRAELGLKQQQRPARPARPAVPAQAASQA